MKFYTKFTQRKTRFSEVLNRWRLGAILFSILFVHKQKTEAQAFANHSEVRQHNGVPTLFVNGKAVPPFAYMSYLGKAEYYGEMAEAGIEIYCLPAYMGDRGINSRSGIKPFRPNFWKGINAYDFSVIRDEFDELLKVREDAKVIIRIHLEPPVWWEQQNPEELCLLPDGTRHRISFSSQKWRADAGKALIDLLEWIRRSKYNQNLIGIHVAGGMTEEWFYHFNDHFHDLSQPRREHYRNWLRNRYHHTDSLRKAWRDETITFETALPADISGQHSDNLIRQKGDHPQLDDTFEFHGQVMAQNIAYFTGLVKKASDRRLLTGAFYGYHLFVHDPRWGHGSLYQLLNCPDLDYLSSPNDYRREVGIDWLPMSAIRSVQLHGKLWLAENDTRTALTTLLRARAPHVVPDQGDWYDKGVWLGPQDLSVSRELLWKNAARMLAYGYGGWWFDMWGGWFSDPEMRRIFSKTNELYEETIGKSSNIPDYTPEVAVIVDEKLAFRDGSYGRITGNLLANRYSLGSSGTPFDIYLREDLKELWKKKYKFIWYLGCYDPTPEEEKLISVLRRQTPVSLHTNHHESVLYETTQMKQRFPDRIRWTPEQLRTVYNLAKVHIFSEQDDVIYAGRGWLAVHLATDGRREITLPSEWKLIQVKDGKSVTTRKLLLEGRSAETFLFRIE